MCLISVPNLKEIHPGDGCFFLAQETVVFSWLKIVVNQCEEVEEKCEDNLAISETHISQTTYLIFSKFGM